MINATASDIAPVAATVGHNRNPLELLDSIYDQQVEWTNTLYKSANERLLGLLSDCVKAYYVLHIDRHASKCLTQQLKEWRLVERDGTHLATRIVRYVFRLNNSRTSAYARVVRAAIDKRLEASQVAAWVTEQGGIESVRLGTDGVSDTEKRAQLLGQASDALATVAAIATLDKVPELLAAGGKGHETFSLALIRHNPSTGQADIVWGDDNCALTKAFITAVGKKVLEKQGAATASVNAQTAQSALADALAAPALVDDSPAAIAA